MSTEPPSHTVDTPAPFARLRAEAAEIARLAWPIAAAQLALVSMSLVDTAIVGRASEIDLAGVALGNSVSFTALTLAMGITFALEPLASQAIGSGAPRKAWASFTTTLRVATVLCVPMAIVAFAATWLLPALRVQPEIVPATRANLVGRLPGQVFFVAFLAGKTYLQALGRTRPALLGALVANGVNAVACALLVLGDRALRTAHLPALGLPALGALGAGIANSLGSFALALVVLRAVWTERPREGSLEHVAPLKVFKLGLPAGLQLLAEVGVFSTVSVLAGRLGARVVSAHQIALGLASFTFMAALGVSGATAVRVGRAVGAGTPARHPGLLGIALGAAVMSIGALAFALIPSTLVRAFTDKPDVIATGAELLAIAALFQLFDGMQAVAAGALRGAGDVRFPFVANVVAHWAVGLPLAIGLAFGLKMGARGLWWGLTAGLVTVALALTARFVWLSRGTIKPV